MRQDLVFPKGARNTVNRYGQRGAYDLRTIHGIINASPVLHVSFVPDPSDDFPAILPMIGVMASFDYPSADVDEPLDCYLHGYVSSRLVNLTRTSAGPGREGLPLCIAATKVDGLVLSLTPNSHSYNYRSAVLHGYASVVDSEAEKLWAMERITNSVVADRWRHSRIPPDKSEMDSTRILRVRVVSASAKIRQGEPHDSKKDLEDAKTTASTWTGVIPVHERLGEAISAPTNEVSQVPEYLAQYIETRNGQSELQALAATKELGQAGASESV